IDAELPGGIEWERCGSLDLLTDERQEAEGRAMAEIQRAEGLPVEMLSTEDVIAKAPALDAAQVRGAKWTPGDGQLNPFKLVYGLLEAAHRMGARSVRGVRVVRGWGSFLGFSGLEVPRAGGRIASDASTLVGGFLVCGLTGHGLPYSAGIALLVSELISSGARRALPLEPFDPQRYVGVARE